jgi:DNA repair ATPase RecN
MPEINLEFLAEQLSQMRTDIEAIKIHVSGLPLIATTLHELRDDARDVRADIRMVKAAINDMARINITAGEVETLHAELDRLADAQIDIRARLALLEQK